MTHPAPATHPIETGRPLVFRGGTVVTMDQQRTVLEGADVLIVGEDIAAVGHDLDVPEGTLEVDATGGIVMPGMVDTPPAPVADGDAGLRRRLDADAILRLVLP